MGSKLGAPATDTEIAAAWVCIGVVMWFVCITGAVAALCVKVFF